MFPSFREEDVIATQVARARVAEPVHPVGAVKPDPFAVPGLVLASSAQVYPDIVHGQAIGALVQGLGGVFLDKIGSR